MPTWDVAHSYPFKKNLIACPPPRTSIINIYMENVKPVIKKHKDKYVLSRC